jgi:cellulose synthase/poly-beta-1,6-N-acetylglucosamine synthase-like glycosyltransferase
VAPPSQPVLDEPQPSPADGRRVRARLLGLIAFLAVSLAYLAWRALHTINLEAPAYSWAFWAAEAFSVFSGAAFYATVLDRTRRRAPPALPGLSVDVLVCSYNESLDLVRQTLRRAHAMRYPHRTWLLDDGHRPEARRLAEALGCRYLSRERNDHFKAGNLNNALRHADGDLVVVLDADHLVRAEFLERLVGYFADPQVALVQTPQVFYNVDSFQHHLRAGSSRLWHEGAIFHHAMQPGADRWNAAFFVGTGAVLRRSALEHVGGFATGSVTEDCFTSMRLHAGGWRSVYHDEPLGYLLAPESLQQYLTQRLRWAQGSMQILRRENPLWKRGLSGRQRFVYFMALTSFAQAVVHVAFYLAPPLFLLGGPAPVRAAAPLDLALLAGHVAFDLAFFRLMLGPLARPLIAECYKFLNVFAYLQALGGYFQPRRLQFRVTTKGRDGSGSLRLLAPQLAVLLLNATAFSWGVLRLGEAPTLFDALGLLLATGFAGAFVLVGGLATLFAAQRMSSHAETSFADHIPATVGAGDRSVPAVAVRANATELHLVFAAAPGALDGGRLTAALDLDAGQPPLEVAGRVRSVELLPPPPGEAPGRPPMLLACVALDPLPARGADRLFDRFAEETMPRVVDALVEAWTRGPEPLPGPPPAELYFLPVWSNVL